LRCKSSYSHFVGLGLFFHGKVPDLLLPLEKFDALAYQLLEGLVFFFQSAILIGGIVVRDGLLTGCAFLFVILLWLVFDEVSLEFVDHVLSDLTFTWHDTEEVRLEKLVGALFEVRVQGGEESVGVLQGQLRLIGLREAEYRGLHLFLRQFSLIAVLDCCPSFLFALRIRHGGEAEDSHLEGLVGPVVTKDLLHQRQLCILLD
jgi:hypothetical protein